MTTDEERAAGPFRQLAPWQAFCLQASVVVFFLAGSCSSCSSSARSPTMSDAGR
ncbi:hypothetical protein ACWDE9_33525 [Streptomyces olivaceoviridis]